MKYLLSILLLSASCSSFKVINPQFKTEYLHAQSGSISIFTTKTETLFVVKNNFGIGRAKVKLMSGNWSAQSMLRLHLKELEGLTVSGSGHQFELADLQVSRVKSKSELYFDVVLPEILFIDTDEIYFSWVDYYR